MRNLKICLAYNGSAYHGWQRQSNNITVQQTVEEAMEKLLDSKITINGCSRTDAGVHAREYFFNVKTDNPIPCSAVERAMNALLPDDIAVLSCEEAPEDFHARFSAKGKEYIYLVNNSKHKDVFARGLSYFYPYKIEIKKLDEAAKLFVGEHDFAAFCKAESKERLSSTVRTVFDFTVSSDNERVCFTVSGNGFLHNMVRIMVGTLIYINENKRTPEHIITCLETGKRDIAGITIPACGLYLNRVIY